MTLPKFAVGADVFTNGARGNVLEVRRVGEIFVYGVTDTNGAINYYEERALKPAS